MDLPPTRLGGFDLILMRNVLIYFDRSTRASILDRCSQALKPGGILVLGGSETLPQPMPDLRLQVEGSTACFEKKA